MVETIEICRWNSSILLIRDIPAALAHECTHRVHVILLSFCANAFAHINLPWITMRFLLVI